MDTENQINVIEFPTANSNHKVVVKRLIIDNQEIIKEFFVKRKTLSIQYTNIDSWEIAVQLTRKIVELYLKNNLPVKNKIKYTSTPQLLDDLKNERKISIRDADIAIIDNFDYLNDYLAKLITPILDYQIKRGYKLIIISNQKLKDILKINKVLNSIINNYLEIKF